MTLSDPLGDMLTRIRNAQMRSHSKVVTPASNLRRNVLNVLKSEGYIRDYTEVEYPDGKKDIEIELKYFNEGPVIRELKRISTPGRRVYASVKEIPVVANGLGVSILSTSKGVLSDTAAREANVGGEVLCQVF